MVAEVPPGSSRMIDLTGLHFTADLARNSLLAARPFSDATYRRSSTSTPARLAGLQVMHSHSTVAVSATATDMFRWAASKDRNGQPLSTDDWNSATPKRFPALHAAAPMSKHVKQAMQLTSISVMCQLRNGPCPAVCNSFASDMCILYTRLLQPCSHIDMVQLLVTLH